MGSEGKAEPPRKTGLRASFKRLLRRDDAIPGYGCPTDPAAMRAQDYLYSLSAYFAELGHDFSFDFLSGISGEAFKLFYDRLNPPRSAFVFLHNPLRAASASLGFEHEISFYETDKEALEALETHHEKTGQPAIIQTRDGYPLAMPGLQLHTPDGTSGVTRGELRERMIATEGFLELGLFGYYVFTLGERDREPKPHELYLGAFRRASKIARAERQVRGCHVGLVAYDAILNNLKTRMDPARLSYSQLWRWAAWNTTASLLLLEGRRTAVTFLLDSKPAFEEDDQWEALDDAAKRFGNVCEHLERVREQHPTTDPAVSTRFVFDVEEDAMTMRDVKRFLSASRKASPSLEKAHDAETKAVSAMRRVISIHEKTRM